jgi:hypothetical protein
LKLVAWQARPTGERLVLNRFVLGLTLGAAVGGLLSCFVLTALAGIFIGPIISVSCSMILDVWTM